MKQRIITNIEKNLEIDMYKLDVNWSVPYKYRTEYGDWWKREWIIPELHLNNFFSYWRENSFALKEKGFGVQKKENKWHLIESKPEKYLFKGFEHLKPKEEVNTFELIPVEVKNTNGLRPWQIESVGKLCAAIQQWGCAIDGSDVGTGKTFVACAVARELNMDIVVVCPKAVMESWRRVIKNHFNLEHRFKGIINYESLRRGKSDSHIASFIRNKKTHINEFIWKIDKNTLIVWDESQKLKGSKTKNSDTCMKALQQGYKMLFCSATNATNPLELKTVGTALKLFKNNKEYYSWLYKHGVQRGRFGLEFNGNAEILTKLHKDIFIDRGVRLSRDVIPNFPESQITAECYDMEEESRNKIDAIYAEMNKELKKLNKKIKTENKNNTSQLTAILRARQSIELVKVPLFMEMIEEGLESGMSVVVFLNFTESLMALADRLNTKCIVNGIVSDRDRQKNIDDFQNDKQRVILVNIAAGGAGLSLHDINGKYPRLAIISPSYSAVQMRQSTGRVWRDNAKSKSIQKIVFVANTVEVAVCESVNKKLNNLDLLNDGDLSVES